MGVKGERMRRPVVVLAAAAFLWTGQNVRARCARAEPGASSSVAGTPAELRCPAGSTATADVVNSCVPAATATQTPGRLDTFHSAVTDRLRRTANWADSFFADERHEAERNQSRMRLRFDSFIEEGDSLGFNLGVNLRLRLPGTSKRLALVISGDSDNTDSIQDTREDNIRQQFAGTDAANVLLGLKYQLLTKPHRSLISRGGVRFRSGSPAGLLSARYRELHGFGAWGSRFTQRVRWYTDNGFETLSRLDFDRTLGEDMLFRITGQGSWFEDRDGFFYDTNFSLIDPLSADRAVEYQVDNAFQTSPTHRLEETIVRLRFRMRTRRQWLVFEISPQISLPRDRDFEFTPGILLRTEVDFGVGVELVR